MTPRAIAAVAAGGVIGTAARLAIDAALPHTDDAFPWSTLLINVGGALLLGWLVGGLWTRPGMPHALKAGVGSGVLGSFTTFSALTAASATLAAAGATALALAYLAASVVLGLGAALLGLWLGSHIAHRPMPAEISDEGETL